MVEKKIPKKYMFVLQKRFGGQDAVEFNADGTIELAPITVFTDKKLVEGKQKKVQKNTCAYYDAITNKFDCLSSLISTLSKKASFMDYKQNTSYIGYLDDKYMQTLRLTFGDETLQKIAQNANGNQINMNDQTTMDILDSIILEIEDPNSTFTSELANCAKRQSTEKKYNFSTSFLEDIHRYRYNYLVYLRDGCYEEDFFFNLELTKSNLYKDLSSYKNFRELYRFRKEYLKNLELNENKKQEPIVKSQEEKEKVKTKNQNIPGQLSLFDMFDPK